MRAILLACILALGLYSDTGNALAVKHAVREHVGMTAQQVALYESMLATINRDPPKEVVEDSATYLKNWQEIMTLLRQEHPKQAQETDSEPFVNVDHDYESVPFKCSSLPPSKTPPTSVHALRPSDVNIIAALGDSISAGNGVRAKTAWQTLFPNKGEAFSAGGERSLDEGAITLPNILRKYNKDLDGASHCARTRLHDYSGYNVALPGGTNNGLVLQASDLISKLAVRPEEEFYDWWKVVTLFIGGNDMCRYCLPELAGNFTPKAYRTGIENALDLMHNHLPRTFVNLQVMTDISIVPDLIHNGTEELCARLHAFECPCATSESRAEVKQLQMEYARELDELVKTGKYDTREDFTVVLQPHLRDQEPFRLENGEFDMSYFGPDCFHPGVKTHQAFAMQLWNVMLTPVGKKPFEFDTSEEPAYKCPTEDAPYFYTSKNSG